MDLKTKTQKLSEYYNIKPARSRGQNFLIKEGVFDRVLELADLEADDTVLEIGPGLGFLTTKLAQQVKKVIAVELDDKLAEVLTAMVKKSGIDNIEIRNKSILDVDIDKELPQNYKIVANLPYQITSKFLRVFLSSPNRPRTMTLMLQKEVAERIVARPGKMSLLALSVQFYSQPELKDVVPRYNFWPEPAVDSALIQLRIKDDKVKKVNREAREGGLGQELRIKDVEERDYFRLAKIGFSAKRKMLKNNLSVGLKISPKEAEEKLVKLGFSAKVRAQELSIDDWARLLE